MDGLNPRAMPWIRRIVRLAGSKTCESSAARSQFPPVAILAFEIVCAFAIA